MKQSPLSALFWRELRIARSVGGGGPWGWCSSSSSSASRRSLSARTSTCCRGSVRRFSGSRPCWRPCSASIVCFSPTPTMVRWICCSPLHPARTRGPRQMRRPLDRDGFAACHRLALSWIDPRDGARVRWRGFPCRSSRARRRSRCSARSAPRSRPDSGAADC